MGQMKGMYRASLSCPAGALSGHLKVGANRNVGEKSGGLGRGRQFFKRDIVRLAIAEQRQLGERHEPGGNGELAHAVACGDLADRVDAEAGRGGEADHGLALARIGRGDGDMAPFVICFRH